MRQTGDLLAQHLPIGPDIWCANLQQIVEAAGYHVTFLDLGDAQDGLPEFFKRALSCIAKFDFGKSDMAHTQFFWIDDCPEASNETFVDQALEPDLARCLRQSDAVGQFGDGHATIHTQLRYDLAIDLVKLAINSHITTRKNHF